MSNSFAWEVPPPLRYPSRINGLLFLLLLIISCCFLVYVLPSRGSASIGDSFDTFIYALSNEFDPNEIRLKQRFLQLYPPAISAQYVQIFASILHFSLLAFALLIARSRLHPIYLVNVLAAACTPESVLFLSCVSKDALSVLASLVLCLAIVSSYLPNSTFRLLPLPILGFLLGEASRPGLGFVFIYIFFVSLWPLHARYVRQLISIFSLLGATVLLWFVISGPLHEVSQEALSQAQSFLVSFERDLASQSQFKSFFRQIFASTFLSLRVDFLGVLILLVVSLFKGFVYFFAFPIVSLPSYPNPPAQVWAVTWQIAVSSTTLFTAIGLCRLFKLNVSALNRSLLLFSLLIYFVTALSTPFLHVRYRAPASAAFLFFALNSGILSRSQLTLWSVAWLGIVGFVSLFYSFNM